MIGPGVTMSGFGPEGHIVKRVRQKFEKLEELCMDRYQTREAKVLNTLQYCVNSLDQVNSWAQFGLMPQDGDNGDRYLTFVDFKYQSVIDPLRKLLRALQKEGQGPLIRQQSMPAQDPQNGDFAPMKDRINDMSRVYLEEGHSIRGLVLRTLQKNRKDIRVIYRWGQASLMDLHDVMDDAMADELYFMVRGKMARTLSTMSALEDVCEQIEKGDAPQQDGQGLSQGQGAPQSQGMPQGMSPRASPRQVMEGPPIVPALNLHDSGRFSAEDTLRSLEERLGEMSQTSRSEPASAEGSVSGVESRGSTPEPPISPRPKGLANHPKIVRERLHSLSLPSKFGGGNSPMNSYGGSSLGNLNMGNYGGGSPRVSTHW